MAKGSVSQIKHSCNNALTDSKVNEGGDQTLVPIFHFPPQAPGVYTANGHKLAAWDNMAQWTHPLPKPLSLHTSIKPIGVGETHTTKLIQTPNSATPTGQRNRSKSKTSQAKFTVLRCCAKLTIVIAYLQIDCQTVTEGKNWYSINIIGDASKYGPVYASRLLDVQSCFLSLKERKLVCKAHTIGIVCEALVIMY